MLRSISRRIGTAILGTRVNFLKIAMSPLLDLARVHSSNDTIAILITFLYELDPTRGLF